jgi:hypothetical protein
MGTIFDSACHRRIEHYGGRITAQVGVIRPPE